jgi:hypothetical protein
MLFCFLIEKVHPIFHNQWAPLFIFIGWILFSLLVGTVKNVWCVIFEGAIYGKVVMENGDNVPQHVENIEISWDAGSNARKCNPVLTNSKGEYRFDRDVPVGHYLSMTARDRYHREIRINVGEIEGVKWFVGLPISSGIPKRVDFTIPAIPSPTAVNQ